MLATGIDKRSELIIFQEILHEKNPKEKAQSVLLQLFPQPETVPREIWMTKETRSLLNPLLEKLRIKVIEVEKLPLIKQLKQFLEEISKF